jgi:hypothetical protein
MRMLIITALLMTFLGFGLISCKSRQHYFSDDQFTQELIPSFQLQHDTTQIWLSDWFTSEGISHIDSIRAHHALRTILSRNKRSLILIPRSFALPPVSLVNVWVEGFPFSLIVKKSGKSRYVLRFNQGDRRHRSVDVVGDMTNWEPVPMILLNGIWQQYFYLEPGEYLYRFIVDRKEITDPESAFVVNDSIKGALSLFETRKLNQDGLPVLKYQSFRRNTISLNITNDADEIIVLWQNFQMPAELVLVKNNQLFVQIPADAKTIEKSIIRIYAYNNLGASNELTIPLLKGIPDVIILHRNF